VKSFAADNFHAPCLSFALETQRQFASLNVSFVRLLLRDTLNQIGRATRVRLLLYDVTAARAMPDAHPST
jgi:hypothetical protein